MKKIILVLTLLVPAAVFIFLKFFGRNEFNIPVYYESGVPEPPSDCGRDYSAPYAVDDSVLVNAGWKKGATLIIKDSSINVMNNLKQIDQEFDGEVQLVFPVGAKRDKVFRCDLLLTDPWTVVLIDDQRKIRGYYQPETREEADRLMVELKILLKKY